MANRFPPNLRLWLEAVLVVVGFAVAFALASYLEGWRVAMFSFGIVLGAKELLGLVLNLRELKYLRAHAITSGEDLSRLECVVRDQASALRSPMPEVILLPSPSVLAVLTRPLLGRARLVISRTCVQELTLEPLRAVIAHELRHDSILQNVVRRIRAMLVVPLVVLLLALHSRLVVMQQIIGDGESWKAALFILPVGVVLCQVMLVAYHRLNLAAEFDADAAAVRSTSADALRTALESVTAPGATLTHPGTAARIRNVGGEGSPQGSS